MVSGDPEAGNITETVFTRQEQEAVDFFREYQDIICNTLRYPRQLEKKEEWPRFLVFLQNLDSALCKSSFGDGRLLFHGVRNEYAGRLLFLLDVPAGLGKRTPENFTPHIIQDPSYAVFTPRLPGAMEKPAESGSPQILFVYQGQPEDSALFLDEHGSEVLFPRNSRWLTTGCSRTASGVTCIVLEKFG